MVGVIRAALPQLVLVLVALIFKNKPLAIGSAAVTFTSIALISLHHRMTKDIVTLAIAASTEPTSRTATIRDALANALPGKVFNRSEKALASSIQSYWSAQEQSIVPECIVQPETVHDVATAMALLAQETKKGTDVPRFAVRSGGHSPIAGFANIAAGIVIDLSKMNSVRVSEDRSSAVIGPGARWIDVSEKLDRMDLAVTGGRVSNAGVAGLTLGGGISFFSPRTGFVCDNMINFEVVLADGSIVDANEQSHKDLWIALKGGGNNFGIVTSFTARTFPQGQLWAGYNYHPASVALQLLKAFHDFCNPESYDEYANTILAFGFDHRFRSVGIGQSLQYTKAVKNPPAHQPFMKVRRFWSTIKFRSLSSATKEINGHSPPGLRQLFCTTTFENNLDMLNACHAIYMSSISAIKSVKGIVWSLVVMPLPPAATSKSRENCLGIDTDKTLIIALLSTSWKKEADDDTVNTEGARVISEIEARAKTMHIYHPYKYVNYASRAQDPLAGYGEHNLASLREVSQKYDPSRIFQDGCIGGFKLDKTDVDQL